MMRSEEEIRGDISQLEEWILFYRESMVNRSTVVNIERIITLAEHIVKDGNKIRLLNQVLRGTSSV